MKVVDIRVVLDENAVRGGVDADWLIREIGKGLDVIVLGACELRNDGFGHLVGAADTGRNFVMLPAVDRALETGVA